MSKEGVQYFYVMRLWTASGKSNRSCPGLTSALFKLEILFAYYDELLANDLKY